MAQKHQDATVSPEDSVNRKDLLDPHTRFFYMPHTVTALLIGVATLVWYSKTLSPDPDGPPDYRGGLFACCVVYLTYSTLQGPASVMIRPHPAFWKLIHGVAMIYLLGLVFMLVQGKDEARQMLKALDPNLGVPLAEREYGTDCRLYIPGEGIHWKVIKDTLLDEFVIAHSLGWWAKALIMRNYWLLWTCSIGFELMELTFQHWLLNFNECWWDSWLLDVMICNLGGMILGMATVRYFGSKRYNWQGLSKQKGLFNKAGRGLMQFTPHSLEIWNWATFRSPTRFLQTLLLVAIIMVFELHAFSLKTLLWLPPPHILVVGRLVMVGFLALPGVKEYHAWINSDSRNALPKLGAYAWIAGAILFTETALVIKFAHGEFTAPFPEHIVFAWSVFGALLATFLVAWQVWIWGSAYLKKASPAGKMKKVK